MPFYTHGIEAQNFENLHVSNFSGGASRINQQAARIYSGKGTGFAIDDAKGVVRQK